VTYVYDNLYDARSREVYEEIIKSRMCNRYPSEKVYDSSSYFAVAPFRRRNPNEIFVDCGGYVGDTIEQYLWKREGAFNKIISFEVDESNYRAMRYRIERLRKEWNIKEDEIQAYLLGVGKSNAQSSVQMYDKEHGLGSKIIENSVNIEDIKKCKIISLDTFLKTKYHFLKADIESYEYDMLLGAEQGIKKYHPMLAICIYHNAVDLYSILPLIKAFVPEYKFSIRHHSSELSDTVLYAWIEE